MVDISKEPLLDFSISFRELCYNQRAGTPGFREASTSLLTVCVSSSTPWLKRITAVLSRVPGSGLTGKIFAMGESTRW